MNDNDPQNEPIKEFLKNANAPHFDFDKPYQRLQEEARANTAHTPRQQGPWLICNSCAYQHTLSYIGPNKLLMGFDEEGAPILKNR